MAPIPETVLDIGCRSAQGAALNANILSGIWAAFALPASGPPIVQDAEGNVMTYWGNHCGPFSAGVQPGYFSVAGLIQQDDGRCGAWSRLLVAVLAAQGITAQPVTVTPDPVASLSLGGLSVTSFHVKPSLPAQGTARPWNYFSDHAVVTLTGICSSLAPFTIYDPSYGNMYSVAGATSFTKAEQAWEKASVLDVVYDYTRLLGGTVVTKPPTAATLFSFNDPNGVSI